MPFPRRYTLTAIPLHQHFTLGALLSMRSASFPMTFGSRPIGTSLARRLRRCVRSLGARVHDALRPMVVVRAQVTPPLPLYAAVGMMCGGLIYEV